MEVAILDIEGTVCPITFVKDVLFPYFLDKLPTYLQQLRYPLRNDSEDVVERTLSAFPESQSLEALSLHLRHLVETDQKVAPLKAFQGIVWEQGYHKGELQAPLFADGLAYIKNPPVQKVYIYSSGSIPAQKLLFQHVQGPDGPEDVTPYLAGYFDITTAGRKTERESYTTILREIGYESKPHKVVFYSDNVLEVRAALAAGLKSVVVVKPGNAPLGDIAEPTTTELN